MCRGGLIGYKLQEVSYFSPYRVPTIIYDFFAEITRPKDGQGEIDNSTFDSPVYSLAT